MPPASDTVLIEIQDCPYIPVFINGIGPLSLLMDTGGVGYWVSDLVAIRTGMKIESELLSTAQTFNIGSTTWYNLLLGLNEAAWARTLLNREIDGLLGNLFLLRACGNYNVILDYPAQTIAFHEHKFQEDTDRYNSVPIQLSNYYTTVPVYVNGTGPHTFLLDTGAATCVIAPSLARRLSLPRGLNTKAKGAAVDIDAFNSMVEKIAVGISIERDFAVIVMDCSNASKLVGTRIDGYLGHSFLKRYVVSFEYWRGAAPLSKSRTVVRCRTPCTTKGCREDRPGDTYEYLNMLV